ncbi:MAG: lipoyl synthase [Gammaproteobacteria bacterium]|nr:lipoyl synthase [Gammaproteobacteria bacterium]
MNKTPPERPARQRGADKVARIPVKVEVTTVTPRKPAWIKARAPNSPRVLQLKTILRQHHLHTVCEEAACPNLGECFSNGTATFMIMGDVCTRRCPFCDVAHGKPGALDDAEPQHLAQTIAAMQLNYVVITSVDRDDLRDGGAGHFAACIAAVRAHCPQTRIETLVPDFRGRMGLALSILATDPPDIFNHNLETVPRLYRQVRPGADYTSSLQLLRDFKQSFPAIPTKSGLMLGLGETVDEVIDVMKALRAHHCEMLTLGQYLQPSKHHLPVSRFITPAEFTELAGIATGLGFTRVASGPMVRSSYHADLQADGQHVS